MKQTQPTRLNRNASRVKSTATAIDFVLEETAKSIKALRQDAGNILALQAVVFLFKSNPASLFVNRSLGQQAIDCANTVRDWCLKIFKEHGGGPEVADRIIGPDRNAVMAANQALLAFREIRDEADRIMSGDDGSDRRQELIKKAEAGTLTEAEQLELTAMREQFRAMMSGKRQIQDTVVAVIDQGIAEGKLTWPETTSRERARELFIAATTRPLTPEEEAEIGLIGGQDNPEESAVSEEAAQAPQETPGP